MSIEVALSSLISIEKSNITPDFSQLLNIYEINQSLFVIRECI